MNSSTAKKPSQKELKETLTPIQYKVTQESGTEPPYTGIFDKFYEAGIYKCLICKVPLFSSDTKFNSGCGWPAFFDELKEANIRKIVDKTHGMTRTEVRCGSCDSHLGHVFEDGPQDKTGIRYCINSASLAFDKKE